MLRLAQVAALAIAVTATNAAEHEAVAAVLIAEAGGEGPKGMRAVMEVIQNRARRNGTTRYNVIKAKEQFSALNETTIAELIAHARRHKLWKRAQDIALRGTATDLTNGADHYHEESITPYWADPKRRTAKVGRHWFYRLEK